MDNLKNTTDIRDELGAKKQITTNLQLNKYAEEKIIRWTITIVAIVMVVIFSCALLYFSLSCKFLPHKIYDLPVIITFSAIPLTIIVMFIRYFYKSANKGKSKNKDNTTLKLPQMEILNAVIELLNKVKDIYKK